MRIPNNIIQLSAYRDATPDTGIDLAAYEVRGLRRYRRASACSIASTVVDCLMSAVIGVCVCICTLVFLTIL